ncbi:MAG: VOC family protein [Acidimicrobiales bacterium]
MPNPVTHFEVNGQDAGALQGFFAELFGWEVNADNPMNYGMVPPQDGKGIGGGISGGFGASYVTFYVEVEDLQATLDQAVALGGSVVMPVTDIPGVVTFAQFATPEGHVIGLAKAMPAPE